MWRKVKRFINYVLLFSGVILLGSGISLYVYKDRIVRQLIREANKQINTPINVEKIELDLIEKFPQIAISLDNINVEESWPQSHDPLLMAKKVLVTLNPLELISGNYEINQLHIEDAEIFIRIDKEGANNFTIFSKTGSDGVNDSLVVDLKKIGLSNVYIHYQDANNQQTHKYHTERHEASVRLSEGKYRINLEGDLKSEFIRIQGKQYATEKNTQVNSQLLYNPEDRTLLFEPTKILIRDSQFSVSGKIQTGEKPNLDLKIEGVDTDVQSLISLLPEENIDRLKDYESKGEVYFSMGLNGYTQQKVEIDISFGLKNAELSHPKLSHKASAVFLRGSFLAPSFSSLGKSTLELADVKGVFGSYPFEGQLTLQNFNDPVARAEISGTFEVEEILKWLPESRIESGSGLVNCQLSFNGRINDLKSRYTSQKVNTSGEVQFRDVVFNFKQNFPLPTRINGDFVFNRNDLAINNTSIHTGQSSWNMNGYFRNLLPFLLFENQHIGIEADVDATYIDIAEILPTPRDQEEESIQFSIHPNLLLNFNCEVDNLVYKRFESRNVSGDLKVKDSKIFAQNIDFEAMGGKLQFSGLVNASKENIVITSSSHWENLSIDSVFYVFNNFNQDWLVAENLEGSAFADVMTDMTFSPDLTFFPDSLIADISITIMEGELNNFEPMIQLEKYVEDENLAHLKFSEIQNDIHVENSKIYLPEMEVRSNVSNILVSGSHTFDQHIDYRVVVPFKALGKNKDEEMFGAVAEDESGSKLHLKITGTTSDYEIKYDTQGVKNKVVADLKKEVEELKKAFQKKENKVTEAVLNEEEFFEWEEDTIKNHIPNIPKLPLH